MNKKLIVLLLFSLIVYSANIWGTSIYILDEAKNAGCAMEMFQRHDLVVPTFDGELRTDKPPLHYFFMMASYQLLGVSPFSARLFSAVMGVLTILISFLFIRKIVNEGTAFFSSLIMISSIQLAIQFHLAVPDPYLLFFLTTGWLSFYYAYQTNIAWFFYLFYLAIGLATLAKGPVAIVFTGLIVLVFLMVVKKFTIKEILRLRIIHGVLIFCVIVLPWYIVVGIKTDGEWLQQFFFKHNVARFTSSIEGHGGFPLASLVIVIVGLIPFSFFLPQMINSFQKEKRRDPFLILCFISVIVIILFFAFSRTILPTYPEPALPFLAILLGHYFSAIEIGKYAKRSSMLASALTYVVISLAIPFAVRIALGRDESLNDLAGVSVCFIVLPIGALVGLYFVLRGELVMTIYSYAVSNLAFLIVFFYIVFPLIDSGNPVSRSLSILKGVTSLVCYRDFNPAYVMALHKTIPKVTTPEGLLNCKAAFVISQKKYLPVLDSLGYKIIFEGKDLFEKPVTIILKK